MLVESAALWVAQTNCYVAAAEPGGPCVLIDVPPDVTAIEALVAAHDLSPVAALVTHGHVDHAGGGAVTTVYEVAAHLHPDDEFLALDLVSQIRMLFGIVPPELAEQLSFPAAYTPLAHGERLELAGLTFDVVHTPGHTPGHCCFHLPDEGVLFSGDQLFAGSIGRTDLPGGDLARLTRSMAEQVMTLPDDVEVLPGHGPPTTIGRERVGNPFRDLWER